MKWRCPHAAAVCAAILGATVHAGALSAEMPHARESETSLDVAIRTLDRLAAVSVSMHAANVTVEQVMRMLYDMTGVPVVVDPGTPDEAVLGATISMSAEDASALSMLNQLIVALPSHVAEAGALSFLAVGDRIVLMDVGTIDRRSAARFDVVYPWSALGPEIFAAAQEAGAGPDPADATDALRETDISRAGLDQACRLLIDLAALNEWRPGSGGLHPSADFLKGGLRINAPAHVHRGLRKLPGIGEAVGAPRISIECAVIEVPRGAMHASEVGSGRSAAALAALHALGISRWSAKGAVPEGGVYRAHERLDDRTQIHLTMSPEAPDMNGRRAVPLVVTAESPDASLRYEVQAVMSGRDLVILLELPLRESADGVRLLTMSLRVQDD